MTSFTGVLKAEGVRRKK